MGEHLPCKQGVSGSSPLTSTRNKLALREKFFDNCTTEARSDKSRVSRNRELGESPLRKRSR